MTAKVEIYSTAQCPYCVRAKMLMEAKGVDYTEYDIRANFDDMRNMLERSGGMKSVPQIFIDDKHYGGYDKIKELDVKGELDKILKR